ncbi:MAG: hypothetical protein ACOVRK_15830 [Chryseobacterium taeanense]
MGIFDIFKKKNKQQETKVVQAQPEEKTEVKPIEILESKSIETSLQNNEEVKSSDLYQKTKIYNDYIVYSISLQLKGDYAPIAAYEKQNGEIQGFLYLITDESYSPSSKEVIERMEGKFENELREDKIKSYIILYHSQFENNGNHSLATRQEELKAITMAYHFKDSDASKIGLPYVFENDEISYRGFSEFSNNENNEIMLTELVEGKDYFVDREEIEVPETINEIGIKIKKSNSNTLGNTWGGIFGFEHFQNSDISDYLVQTMALCKMDSPEYDDDKIRLTDFKDVQFKTVFTEDFSTIYPEVKTDFSLDLEMREINEWENAQNLEAVVCGKGRDTFGVWFFATDYAENKNVYQLQNKLNVNISGIVFVLDIHQKFDLPDGTKLSDDFTTYMPNNDIPNYALFDFVAQLIDFRETELLEDGSIKGYMLKLRLITNSEMEDFFTIDAFVNKENMRFETLTKGMKVMGAIQLQGKISQ